MGEHVFYDWGKEAYKHANERERESVCGERKSVCVCVCVCVCGERECVCGERERVCAQILLSLTYKLKLREHKELSWKK